MASTEEDIAVPDNLPAGMKQQVVCERLGNYAALQYFPGKEGYFLSALFLTMKIALLIVRSSLVYGIRSI